MLFTWVGWLNNPIIEVIIILLNEETKARRAGILEQDCTINNWEGWDLKAYAFTPLYTIDNN